MFVEERPPSRQVQKSVFHYEKSIRFKDQQKKKESEVRLHMQKPIQNECFQNLANQLRVSNTFEKHKGAQSELSDSYTILEGRILSKTHFGRDVSDGLAMFKNPCKIHRHLRKDKTRFTIGFCI